MVGEKKNFAINDASEMKPVVKSVGQLDHLNISTQQCGEKKNVGSVSGVFLLFDVGMANIAVLMLIYNNWLRRNTARNESTLLQTSIMHQLRLVQIPLQTYFVSTVPAIQICSLKD